MEYEEYRKRYFVEPAPDPKFEFAGLYGTTLFFQDYDEAKQYYQCVLGPPAYVEGSGTTGWRVGDTWLTLLRGENGNPQNVEIAIVMPSPHEAERLQQAFVEAGGTAPPPTDALMYVPIRMCPVTDPFGTPILIYSLKDET